MSVFLQVSSRFLIKIMLILSVLFVFRGHHYPGGGFIGALVATSAIALYTLAFSLRSSGFDRWAPRVIAIGLLCFILSMLLPIFFSKIILTGLWVKLSVFDLSIKLGSPLIFDFGVYFSIVGSLTWIFAEIEGNA